MILACRHLFGPKQWRSLSVSYLCIYACLLLRMEELWVMKQCVKSRLVCNKQNELLRCGHGCLLTSKNTMMKKHRCQSEGFCKSGWERTHHTCVRFYSYQKHVLNLQHTRNASTLLNSKLHNSLQKAQEIGTTLHRMVVGRWWNPLKTQRMKQRWAETEVADESILGTLSERDERKRADRG